MKKFIALFIGLLIGTVAVHGATKFNATSDGGDAELTFGAAYGNQSVTAISAISDAAGELLKVYTRNANGFYNPNAAITSTAVIITFENPSQVVTNGDIVVIEYADGSVMKAAVSAQTTNSITIDTPLTAALSTSDRFWEMTQVYQATVGTSLVTPEGNPIVDVPAESPVYISLSAQTNANVSVTVK